MGEGAEFPEGIAIAVGRFTAVPHGDRRSLIQAPPDPNFTLEVLKALGAPIAALISVAGVLTAALLAIRGFRAQKRIERRLQWYDQVLDAVEEVRTTQLAFLLDPNDVEKRQAATAAFISTVRLQLRGYLYAGPHGLEAVGRWREAIAPIDRTKTDFAVLSRIEAANAEVSLVLIQEARQELGLKGDPKLYFKHARVE